MPFKFSIQFLVKFGRLLIVSPIEELKCRKKNPPLILLVNKFEIFELFNCTTLKCKTTTMMIEFLCYKIITY